jgi:hypothetical protein
MSNDDDDADAMLMITATTMTTMMLRKHLLAAMFLCANRAGTLATVPIEITDVQTTKKLTAASKGTPKIFCPDVQCPHCDLLGHQSETCCHRSLTTNPTPNFPKYAAHQGTYLQAPTFIHSLILKTCYASDQMTGQAKNARYGMQILSRSNAQTPQTPTSTFHTRLPQWMMTASNASSLSMTSKPTPAGRTPTVSSSSS